MLQLYSVLNKNNNIMPNIKKQLVKCKHPDSRKTKALTKQIKKSENRQKIKLGQQIKQNVLGEKVAWFKHHLNPDCVSYSTKDTEDLIRSYLSRFEEELEQISIKNSIGKRKNRQHASREDIIKLTMKREQEEYNTCGLEMPNVMDPLQLEYLRNWNGELRFLQNFKLRRFTKKYLTTAQKTNRKPDDIEKQMNVD